MTTAAIERDNTVNITHDVLLAKDSLQRCLSKPEFLDIFYEKFLASSDEIKEKFVNTRFPNQKIMLKASLHIMLLLAQGGIKNTETLQKLADKHNKKGLDIRPEFYQYWVSSMIFAVKSCDPKYTDILAEAWINALKPGVDFFTSKY